MDFMSRCRGVVLNNMLTNIRNSELIWEMALGDLKGGSKGAVLGVLWVVINPFIQVAAYVVIVSFLFKVKLYGRTGIFDYATYVLAGMIPWQILGKSMTDAPMLIRASAEPLAGTYSFINTNINTKKFTIWRAHPEKLPYNYLGVPGQVIEIRHESGNVAVLTGEGLLVLEEIEMTGEKRGLASHWIKSTRIRLGLDLAQAVMRLDDRITQLKKKLNEIAKKDGDYLRTLSRALSLGLAANNGA